MDEIEIICRAPGMRRCGVEHPGRRTYPLDRWTGDELAVFEADPMFEVRTIPADVAAEARMTAAAGDPGGTEAALAIAGGADAADKMVENGAGPTEPHLDAAPADDVDRSQRIRVAVSELGEEDRTLTGRPKVAALEARLGFRPSQAEIDATLAEPAATE